MKNEITPGSIPSGTPDNPTSIVIGSDWTHLHQGGEDLGRVFLQDEAGALTHKTIMDALVQEAAILNQNFPDQSDDNEAKFKLQYPGSELNEVLNNMHYDRSTTVTPLLAAYWANSLTGERREPFQHRMKNPSQGVRISEVGVKGVAKSIDRRANWVGEKTTNNYLAALAAKLEVEVVPEEHHLAGSTVFFQSVSGETPIMVYPGYEKDGFSPRFSSPVVLIPNDGVTGWKVYALREDNNNPGHQIFEEISNGRDVIQLGRITSEDESGQRIDAFEGEHIADDTLTASHRRISGSHCTIQLSPGLVAVTDHSKNGTLVNIVTATDTDANHAVLGTVASQAQSAENNSRGYHGVTRKRPPSDYLHYT